MKQSKTALALVVLTSTGFVLSLLAQDLQRNQLPGVNSMARTNSAIVPPPQPKASAVAAEPINAKLGSLNGLVILGSFDDYRPVGITGTNGVVVKGPLFLVAHAAEVKKSLAEFLGQPLTENALRRLQETIVRICRGFDRPVVDVYYPPQDISDDHVIQVIVYEGKFGKVIPNYLGKPWSRPSYITNAVHLKAGDSISQTRLLADLDKLNHNPQFREVNAQYKPAEWDAQNPGTTDINLNIKTRPPLRVFAGYDDYGLKVMGENRIFAGVNYGNLFGADQQLNYQFTTDLSLQHLKSHLASYVVPLPWAQHSLTLFGGYNQIKADLGQIGYPSLNNNGRTYQLSFRYNAPLPSWGKINEDVALGFDYKSADTAVEFGQFPNSPFRADVDQFTLEYHASREDSWGYTRLSLSGYYSPGQLFGKNDDAAFGSFQPGLKSSYFYGRVDGERSFKLPARLLLLLKGGYQLAETSLLPSEQTYLGGFSVLRGYPENVVAGDEGWHASTELHSPLFRTSNMTRQKNVPSLPFDGDSLDVFGFFDYGSVSPKRPTALQNSETTLSSVGAGLVFRISDNFLVNSSYGYELQPLKPTSAPTALAKDRSRIHVSVTVSF